MEEEIKTEQVVPTPPVPPKAPQKTTLTTPSLYGGRFTRKQFWGHYVAILLVSVLLSACAIAMTYSLLTSGSSLEEVTASILPVLIFITIATILIAVFWSLPVFFKRMHDIGGSGWLVILVLFGSNFFELVATGLGGIVSLIFIIVMGCIDSQKGTNKYGTSVKYPD